MTEANNALTAASPTSRAIYKQLLAELTPFGPFRSPRVTKAEQVSKSRWHLDVKLSNIEEIDGELLGWLRQAYDLCA